MMVRTCHWILAAAVVAGAGACSREERAPEAAAVQPPSPNAPAVRDDATITTSVQAKYYGSDEVRGRDITVVARDGVVTLRGAVDSEAVKQRAVALAREVEGVTRVDDELRVETASHAATPGVPPAEQATGTSGRSGDPAAPVWITTKIQAQYFVNPEIKPWNIDVTTGNGGVVTLEGEVDSADDKAEAVRIARATDGVSRVDDRLRIKGTATLAGGANADASGPQRPDAWLTAKIQSKFFLDDEVKGRDIDVETNDAVVTLNGTVANDAQRRQAVAMARNTEGVRNVVDRLKVDAAAAGKQGAAAASAGARPLEPVADLKRPDEWITMKIQSKYFLEPAVKGRQIDVDTTKGVVMLKGRVASAAEKQQAEQIARETDGVTRVVNQLAVGAGSGSSGG